MSAAAGIVAGPPPAHAPGVAAADGAARNEVKVDAQALGWLSAAPYLNPNNSQITLFKAGADFSHWLSNLEIYMGILPTASEQQKIFTILLHCEETIRDQLGQWIKNRKLAGQETNYTDLITHARDEYKKSQAQVISTTTRLSSQAMKQTVFESVQQYYDRFYKESRNVLSETTDSIRIGYFIQGLPPHIQSGVMAGISSFKNLNDAFNQAKSIETLLESGIGVKPTIVMNTGTSNNYIPDVNAYYAYKQQLFGFPIPPSLVTPTPTPITPTITPDPQIAQLTETVKQMKDEMMKISTTNKKQKKDNNNNNNNNNNKNNDDDDEDMEDADDSNDNNNKGNNKHKGNNKNNNNNNNRNNHNNNNNNGNYRGYRRNGGFKNYNNPPYYPNVPHNNNYNNNNNNYNNGPGNYCHEFFNTGSCSRGQFCRYQHIPNTGNNNAINTTNTGSPRPGPKQ